MRWRAEVSRLMVPVAAPAAPADRAIAIVRCSYALARSRTHW